MTTGNGDVLSVVKTVAALPDDAKRRFLGLAVGEVSLVGEPANEQEWLVKKGQEDDMAGEQETVVTKAAGDPNVVAVLKEVGGIVAAVAKLAGVPVPTTVDVEKGKGVTLKAFLKASGMTDDQMKDMEEKAKKAGVDLAMKLVTPNETDAETTPKPNKKPDAGVGPGGAQTSADSAKTKTKKGKEGELEEEEPTKKGEPLTIDSLVSLVAKAKHMTPERLEKLKTVKTVLDELLGDVAPDSDHPPAGGPGKNLNNATSVSTPSDVKPPAGGMEVSKSASADDIAAAVMKGLEPRLKAMETGLEDVKKARPASGSLESDGGTDVKKGGTGSMWKGVL